MDYGPTAVRCKRKIDRAQPIAALSGPVMSMKGCNKSETILEAKSILRVAALTRV